MSSAFQADTHAQCTHNWHISRISSTLSLHRTSCSTPLCRMIVCFRFVTVTLSSPPHAPSAWCALSSFSVFAHQEEYMFLRALLLCALAFVLQFVSFFCCYFGWLYAHFAIFHASWVSPILGSLFSSFSLPVLCFYPFFNKLCLKSIHFIITCLPML